METFFKENSQIQECVDLLIEKLFTVCLLSGSDADSEFYRGRQAAQKIAKILEDITGLTDETLIEGIRQLVEQRLPDPKIIGNFPQFKEYMDIMIQSSIAPSYEALPVINPPNSSTSYENPSSKIVLKREVLPGFHSTPSASGNASDSRSNTVNSTSVPLRNPVVTNTSAMTSAMPSAIPDSAYISSSIPDSQPYEEKGEETEEEDLAVSAMVSITSQPMVESAQSLPLVHEEKPAIPESKYSESITNALTSSIATKSSMSPTPPVPSELLKTSESPNSKVSRVRQIPIEGERLSTVLKQFYPDAQPRWNVAMGPYMIFAQVNNLLIYILKNEKDPGTHDMIKKDLQKQGWHTLICQEEDLDYPRRLERAIRQTLRETIHPVSQARFFR